MLLLVLLWFIVCPSISFDCKEFLDEVSQTSNSQWLQDWFITRNFFGLETSSQRRYIELGSYHPFHLSNSLLLEKCLDWRGTCVEPNPQIAPSFRRNRNCHFISGCAWDSRKNLTLRVHKDPIEATVVDYFADPSNQLTETFVTRCYPLSELITMTDRAIGLGRDSLGRLVVDLLLVDAEGAEIVIFEKFPFHDYYIPVVVLEASIPFLNLKLENIFYENNYEKVAMLGGDWVFVLRS